MKQPCSRNFLNVIFFLKEHKAFVWGFFCLFVLSSVLALLNSQKETMTLDQGLRPGSKFRITVHLQVMLVENNTPNNESSVLCSFMPKYSA